MYFYFNSPFLSIQLFAFGAQGKVRQKIYFDLYMSVSNGDVALLVQSPPRISQMLRKLDLLLCFFAVDFYVEREARYRLSVADSRVY